MKNVAKFLIGFLPILFLYPLGSAYAEEYDLCDNLEGVQATMPAGRSSVGSPGVCYELQAPVTIDLTPPGGEPVTVDTNPVNQDGTSGVAQTIDVNPFNPGTTPQTITVTQGEVTVSTTTPTMIRTVEELQAYIFAPETSNEEKISAIENHIISLMQEIIEILIAEIEAARQAQPE